ncbi:hypothetical protein VTJ49DRAFT_610 [Mycothermus thermophilus]|uniref:Uncharacterized protein n=1 Tax=Humicola insolens TaxID=85995 RepID=A0ABR3VPM7_HUMIN
MAPRTSPAGRLGHIIAIDGPDELVSAQLRLLPASPHIAILPRLQHYLKDSKPPVPGNERDLIRQYRAAIQARHAEAREFLHRSALRGDRPLVFLHGGTMSAVEEAHALFLRRASADVSSLAPSLSDTLSSGKPDEGRDQAEGAATSKDSGQRACGGYVDSGKDTFEDRIIRAMRAAEALDKETEFLQPASANMELTVKLVKIPSRTARQPSATKVEGRKSPEQQRPPSPPEDEGLSTEESASASASRPPLRIRIPSPRGPLTSNPVVDGDSQQLDHRQRPVPESLGHRRLHSNPSPTELSTIEEVSLPGTAVLSSPPSLQYLPQANDGNSENDVRSGIDERSGQPPLPRPEDFVVYLAPQSPSEVHDFVFGRLSEEPTTPKAVIPCSNTFGIEESRGEQLQVTSNEGVENDGGDVHANSRWKRRAMIHGLPTPNHSPNPSETVPPEASTAASAMHRISVGEEDTATAVQSLLRSLLAARLPSEEHLFAATDVTKPETEPEIWGILNREDMFAGPDGESKIDLILTVGAERGVKKERLADLVTQLEKLGSKGSLSRSGRVDIRYLIANAMQAFTAQPLAMQTQSNPFADRALLAALIVPHIETYLSTHPDVRLLLIEYPPEHLATVLALQTVVGTELVKVVSIVDSDEATPAAESSFLTTDHAAQTFGARRGSESSSAFSGPCSFSQGRFVLASSATSLETAALVAAIRETLVSISDDYIPERPLYKQKSAPQLRPKKGKGHTQPPQQESADDGPSVVSSPAPRRPKDLSRVSVSTLVITPPSSPTESENSLFETSQQQQDQQHQTHYHPLPPPPPHHQHQSHHINPRSIPPRSSSNAATTTTNPNPATPHYHVPNPDYSEPPCTEPHPSWQPVYYIPGARGLHITAAMTGSSRFPLSSSQSRCTCQASAVSHDLDQYTEYVGTENGDGNEDYDEGVADVDVDVDEELLMMDYYCEVDSILLPQNAEERRLMPLYVRRRQRQLMLLQQQRRRRGGSGGGGSGGGDGEEWPSKKALRLLGLA